MPKQCSICKSEKIEYIENFETSNPETDEYDLEDGYLCHDCGCFQEKNNKFYEFIPVGPNMAKNCFK